MGDLTIVKVNNNCIYLGKKVMHKAKISNGQEIVLRVTDHGISLCKPSAFQELNLILDGLDKDLARAFINKSHKNKENDPEL